MTDESILSTIDKKDVIAVLGKGSEFDGKLTFDGVVQIDGRFSGEIHSKGTLILGETARVKAEVQVGNVVVKGEVIGNIRAPGCVELHAPAHVVGNLYTPSLYIQKGVIFEGTSVMESKDKSSGSRRQPPPPPTSG